jgi:hypothetical protein
MNKSENINDLSAALSKAQGAMGFAIKDANNPFFKSKYADLSSVVEAIRVAFADNGLSYIQRLHESEKHEVRVETVILHSSGQFISCGILAVPVSKHDAQGFGSALTYARRYSLSAAAGVVADDDDGNAAAQAAPKQENKQSPAKKTTVLACAPSSASTGYAEKPSPRHALRPPIEGEAKAISGDPSEGDLSGVVPTVDPNAPADKIIIGNLTHAFASKLNMTVPKIEEALANWMEATQVKPMSDWTNKDVDEAREMFKKMSADAAKPKGVTL